MSAKGGRHVTRTLYAKAIRYRQPNKDGSPQPRLSELLTRIVDAAPNAGQRHHPEIVRGHQISMGTGCSFINKVFVSGPLHFFHVWTYIKGQAPEAISADLDKPEVQADPIDLISQDGQRKEVIWQCRCLTFGDVLLMECSRGSGGAQTIRGTLNALIRRHVDRRHPALHFEDFTTSEFRDLVQQKRGISKIRARLLNRVPKEGSIYGPRLSKLREQVGGARAVAVEWQGEDVEEISVEEAELILAEYDDESLDGVTITFGDGSSISDLSKYREKTRVEVALDQSGLPVVLDIEQALARYLEQLRDADRRGPISPDGTLRDVRYVSEDS